MLTHNKLAVFGAAGLLFAALPAGAQTAKKNAPLIRTATIKSTGSTNTFGYQITVVQNGKNYRMTGSGDDGSHHVALAGHGNPTAVWVQQFFTDLDAAGPLAKLPVHHGMRSASFGTSTFVVYNGQQSPDLTGGGSAQAAALRGDVQALVKAAGVTNAPRRPLTVPKQ